jgi:hypothetical protein
VNEQNRIREERKKERKKERERYKPTVFALF